MLCQIKHLVELTLMLTQLLSWGSLGSIEQLSVSTLNNANHVLQTTNVNIALASVDGSTKAQVFAYTLNRVTGHMPVVNWKKREEQMGTLS